MLSEELGKYVELASYRTKELRQRFVTIEHLLLALLQSQGVDILLKRLDVSKGNLRMQLGKYIVQNNPRFEKSEMPQDLKFTVTLQRVLNQVFKQIQLTGDCNVLDVFLMIYNEEHAYASYFLRQVIPVRFLLEEEIKDLKAYFLQEMEKHDEERRAAAERAKQQQPTEEQEEKKILTYLTRMTAPENFIRLDKLVGREDEITRLSIILMRLRRNNPIIVGESGVGKTALVHGFVRLLHGNGYNEIYQTSAGILLAGTKYRGDLEERMEKIIQFLSKRKNSILFIDEIHQVINSGQTSDSTVDLSALLMPAIDRGDIRLIGCTSDKEYRRIFEKKGNMARRFQRVDLDSPSFEDCMHIVNAAIPELATYHNIDYKKAVIPLSVKLANRYLLDQKLPASALELLDEAGATLKLQKNPELVVLPELVEDLVAKQARIPSKNINQDDKAALKSLADDLNSVVFGQQNAVEALVQALKLSYAGLRRQEKTIGNFLFTGATGVGKTELCRQLAKTMQMKLIRFDMSEYMEAHSISKWIGTAPGYVGFEQEGLLTGEILKNPYAVLLLDEIEKAHPDIMNVLLQIMDNGIIRDNNGREINCRHVVLIMTSNIGATAADKNAIGFTTQNDSFAYDKAVKQFFSPEFRNRLDRIIHFSPLSESLMLKVVDKFISELREQLHEKNVEISLTEDARRWLAQKGYDPKMGARPLARLMEQQLNIKLADALLFENATKFTVDVGKDELLVIPADEIEMSEELSPL